MAASGQKDTQEALNQIGYMQRLLDDTRVRAADGYPFFLLWGAIWVLGYSSYFVPQVSMRGLIWLPLDLIGAVGSMVIGARMNKGTPATPLSRRLMWLNLVSFGLLLCLPIITGLHTESAVYAFFPFIIGFVYIINGIFVGREMIVIGAWLIVVALVTLELVPPVQQLWLALAGGGSLLVTGFLLRCQVRP